MGEDIKPWGQWLKGCFLRTLNSQTPSTAPSPFNEVTTGHSNLQLHFRNDVLGHFIDSESGDIIGNIGGEEE